MDMTATRRPSAMARVTGRARLRTVPGRIRAWTALAVLAVAGLFATATVYLGDAGDGLRVIGHGSGPQVVATANLYFSLSDMDAQVAGVLLIGRDTGLGTGRDQALATYDSDRAAADHAVLQAADLARGDAAGQRTVQAVLDGLGQYERLAGQALKLNEQANHAAGPPPPQVTDLYRQATDLMKLDLLPKAYNLTLDSGTIVRRTYVAQHSAVLDGRWWIIGAGVVVVALLAGLQLFLARGFRRLVSLPLALATVGTLILVAVCAGLLTQEAAKLQTAKQDGFDSVLALSRARAISNSMSADETRFLLDPGRADNYMQVYLDKAQSILYLASGTSLDKYYAGLAAHPAAFLGFFGSEAAHVTLTGQRAAITDLVTTYDTFQADDQRLRGGGDPIGTRMSVSSRDFGTYDQALVALIHIHQKAFDQAIKDGDGALSGWNWLLLGSAMLLAALILAGVRPRIAEFR